MSFLIKCAGGMVLHPRFVVALLSDLFGVQARGGCACAGPYGHRLLAIDNATSEMYRMAIKDGFEGVKPGWSRLNFNYFISDVEFEFLIGAVEFVASFGYLFLNLYDFNWKSGSWKNRERSKTLNHPAFPEGVKVALTEAGPVPHMRYMSEAIRLAAALQEKKSRGQFSPRPIPSGVNQSLIYFAR